MEIDESTDKTWVCLRCSFGATTKSNLLQHLRRKKPCRVTCLDIDPTNQIEELLKKSTEDAIYSCQYCSQRFTQRSNKSRHMKLCTLRGQHTLKNEIDGLQKKVADLQVVHQKIIEDKKVSDIFVKIVVA